MTVSSPILLMTVIRDYNFKEDDKATIMFLFTSYDSSAEDFTSTSGEHDYITDQEHDRINVLLNPMEESTMVRKYCSLLDVPGMCCGGNSVLTLSRLGRACCTLSLNLINNIKISTSYYINRE